MGWLISTPIVLKSIGIGMVLNDTAHDPRKPGRQRYPKGMCKGELINKVRALQTQCCEPAAHRSADLIHLLEHSPLPPGVTRAVRLTAHAARSSSDFDVDAEKQIEHPRHAALRTVALGH